MTEHNIDPDLLWLSQMVVEPPDKAATLDELNDGFTPERAQEILDSPKLLQHLQQLAYGAAPGAGWVLQALSDGGASRRLLGLMPIPQQDPEVSELQIRNTAAGLRVGTSWLLDSDGQDLARLELPGGWIGWPVWDLAAAPLVQLDHPERGIPSWVSEVAGERIANDIALGKPSSAWDGLMDEPHPVARYALGCWLEQHQPTPLALPVLRLELGTLAHEFSHLIPSEVAQHWLSPLGGCLLSLHAQIRMWVGEERTSVERTLAWMRSAFLATCPDAPEAEAIAGVESATWPESFRSDYALAAESEHCGDDLAEEELLSEVADRRASVLETHLAFPEPDFNDPERPFLAEILAYQEGTA